MPLLVLLLLVDAGGKRNFFLCRISEDKILMLTSCYGTNISHKFLKYVIKVATTNKEKEFQIRVKSTGPMVSFTA